MGSNSRLVAVQAVVVGVLLVIVFVTLLQPESERPFSGIEGPSDQPRTTLPGPDIYTGPPGGTGGGQGQGGGQGAGEGGRGGPLALTGPGDGSGGGTGRAGGEGGTTTTPLTPIGPGGGGSPSDDQYKDALSRLVTRLN